MQTCKFGHLRWTRDRSQVNWEEFLRCQMRANETFKESKYQFNVRNRAVLTNDKFPHKWWSTLKPALFGMSSSLNPLAGGGGGLVYEPLVRPICFLIILMVSSLGRLLICRSLAIHFLASSPSLQVERGQASLVRHVYRY